MGTDSALLASCVLIASLVMWPVVEAMRRRRASRESSDVAAALVEFSQRIRLEQRCLAVEPGLLRRVRNLGIPEVVTFEFAQQMASPEPELLVQAAQRLALRLKRRVAFERKMLARTASGRRRGAIAAAAPGLVILSLRFVDLAPPPLALALLVSVEIFGCWMSWRVARVEV